MSNIQAMYVAVFSSFLHEKSTFDFEHFFDSDVFRAINLNLLSGTVPSTIGSMKSLRAM
jgi:hypothetical protein